MTHLEPHWFSQSILSPALQEDLVQPLLPFPSHCPLQVEKIQALAMGRATAMAAMVVVNFIFVEAEGLWWDWSVGVKWDLRLRLRIDSERMIREIGTGRDVWLYSFRGGIGISLDRVKNVVPLMPMLVLPPITRDQRRWWGGPGSIRHIVSLAWRMKFLIGRWYVFCQWSRVTRIVASIKSEDITASGEESDNGTSYPRILVF